MRHFLRRMTWLLAAWLCLHGFAAAAEDWPATPERLPTTSGDIYMDNLHGRIAIAGRLYARSPKTSAATLAGLLFHRHGITASLDDLERATTLADEAVDGQPRSASALRLRAAIRAAVHRFDEAGADLDAAAALGAPTAAIAAARRDIALALGRYDALRDDFAAARGSRTSDFDALAFHAHLRDLQGDRRGADALYRKAQAAYRDSSPVPLAWLHVQQGIALLEGGDTAGAHAFFAAAHQRLPAYTLATEHLAETESLLGNAARARALYRDAIAASGDPAFMVALASLERAAGETASAQEFEARARTAWDERLARHRRAFGGHAVDAMLEAGQVRRALVLAREAAGFRQDIHTLQALARAEQAAGNAVDACAVWARVRATGLSPPGFEAPAWTDGCAKAPLPRRPSQDSAPRPDQR